MPFSFSSLSSPSLSVPPPPPALVSFVLAALSLSFSFSAFTFHPPSSSQPESPIALFSLSSPLSLSSVRPLVLDNDTRTNRTLWPTVDTPDLHAGLQTVQPHAWIPPHAHTTEELVLVLKGTGMVYDETGNGREITQGDMVHVRTSARHAFRNLDDEDVLVIAWVFPGGNDGNRFEFKQRYEDT